MIKFFELSDNHYTLGAPIDSSPIHTPMVDIPLHVLQKAQSELSLASLMDFNDTLNLINAPVNRLVSNLNGAIPNVDDLLLPYTNNINSLTMRMNEYSDKLTKSVTSVNSMIETLSSLPDDIKSDLISQFKTITNELENVKTTLLAIPDNIKHDFMDMIDTIDFSTILNSLDTIVRSVTEILTEPLTNVMSILSQYTHGLDDFLPDSILELLFDNPDLESFINDYLFGEVDMGSFDFTIILNTLNGLNSVFVTNGDDITGIFDGITIPSEFLVALGLDEYTADDLDTTRLITNLTTLLGGIIPETFGGTSLATVDMTQVVLNMESDGLQNIIPYNTSVSELDNMQTIMYWESNAVDPRLYKLILVEYPMVSQTKEWATKVSDLCKQNTHLSGVTKELSVGEIGGLKILSRYLQFTMYTPIQLNVAYSEYSKMNNISVDKLVFNRQHELKIIGGLSEIYESTPRNNQYVVVDEEINVTIVPPSINLVSEFLEHTDGATDANITKIITDFNLDHTVSDFRTIVKDQLPFRNFDQSVADLFTTKGVIEEKQVVGTTKIMKPCTLEFDVGVLLGSVNFNKKFPSFGGIIIPDVMTTPLLIKEDILEKNTTAITDILAVKSDMIDLQIPKGVWDIVSTGITTMITSQNDLFRDLDAIDRDDILNESTNISYPLYTQTGVLVKLETHASIGINSKKELVIYEFNSDGSLMCINASGIVLSEFSELSVTLVYGGIQLVCSVDGYTTMYTKSIPGLNTETYSSGIITHINKNAGIVINNEIITLDKMPTKLFERSMVETGIHSDIMTSYFSRLLSLGITDRTSNFKIIEDINIDGGLSGPKNNYTKIRDYSPSDGLTVTETHNGRLVNKLTISGNDTAYTSVISTYEYSQELGETTQHTITEIYTIGPSVIKKITKDQHKDIAVETHETLDLSTGLITVRRNGNEVITDFLNKPSLAKQPFTHLNIVSNILLGQIKIERKKYYKPNTKQLLFDTIKLYDNNPGIKLKECLHTGANFRVSYIYRTPTEPIWKFVTKVVTNTTELFTNTEIELYNLTIVPEGAVTELEAKIAYRGFVRWIELLQNKNWFPSILYGLLAYIDHDGTLRIQLSEKSTTKSALLTNGELILKQ